MQTACSSSGTKPAQLTRSSRNRNRPHPSTPAQESYTHAVAIIYSTLFLFNIPPAPLGKARNKHTGQGGGSPGSCRNGLRRRNRAGGANHLCRFQLRHSVHVSVCRRLGTGSTRLRRQQDPAGCLASHSRPERDNHPLFMAEQDGLVLRLQVTFTRP